MLNGGILMNDRTSIMAHRGWSSRAPENTIAAINLAIAEPTISSIEMDVQLSKDGIPVIIHDFTLERTTNGFGFVYQQELSNLKQLDAGMWFSPYFKGEQIPTLEEVLQITKGKKLLNLELKTAGNLYPGLVQKVVDLIMKYKMQDQVIITSFDHHRIYEVSEYTASIPTGLAIYGNPTLLEEQLFYTGASVLSMSFPYLTPSFVESHIEQGRTLIAWTLNSPSEIEYVKSIHQDIIICTDYPENV